MRKKASMVKEQTRLWKVKFAPISQKSQSKAHKGLLTDRGRANKRRVPTSTMSRLKEPEVATKVEPKIWFNVETQAKPPQPTPRKELVASLHPLAPDMPTGEEFLSGWTSVVLRGMSTPSIMSAVTPMMVMAGEMQQLVSTLGIQVTTIPITIPLMSGMGTAPVTFQSQLWLEGHQPKADNEERVVEMELDQEQGDSQEEEGSTQEDLQEEKESKTKGSFKMNQKSRTKCLVKRSLQKRAVRVQ